MMAPSIKTILSKVIKSNNRDDEAAATVDPPTSLEQKIKTTMARVFKIDIDEINEASSSDNVARWTSLGHVDFVLELQKEFDVEFTDTQIVEELLSFKTVVQTVEKALKEKNHR
jgi:acyl carrier protein